MNNKPSPDNLSREGRECVEDMGKVRNSFLVLTCFGNIRSITMEIFSPLPMKNYVKRAKLSTHTHERRSPSTTEASCTNEKKSCNSIIQPQISLFRLEQANVAEQWLL